METFKSIFPGDRLMQNIDTFASLHENEFLLPPESFEKSKLRILLAFITITCVHLFFFMVFSKFSGNDGGNEGDTSKQRKSTPMLKSYQLTNLMVNLVLGVTGIYMYTFLIPGLEETSMTEKVAGYPEYTHLATIQIGYNIWAIPVGLFFVNELKLMIVHHFAVICVASISSFLVNGFRYYSIFFYGVIEISSVPLSVMNMFKRNPKWQKRFPLINFIVRLVFSISFLTVRVFLWIPLIIDYLKHLFMTIITSDNITEVIIFSSMYLSAVLLTILQLFWAKLIIDGIVGLFKKPSEKGRDEKKE